MFKCTYWICNNFIFWPIQAGSFVFPLFWAGFDILGWEWIRLLFSELQFSSCGEPIKFKRRSWTLNFCLQLLVGLAIARTLEGIPLRLTRSHFVIFLDWKRKKEKKGENKFMFFLICELILIDKCFDLWIYWEVIFPFKRYFIFVKELK